MNKVLAFVIRYFFAALACIYLFAIGFLFTKNRFLIAAICAHFGYFQKPVGPIIPKIELSKVILNSPTIQIQEPAALDGNISLLELVAIAQLVRTYNPRRLFEIGTFDGRTTLNMAANSSAKAITYTLDLPREGLFSTKLPITRADGKYIDKEVSGRRYLGRDLAKKIVQLHGDSANFDFSPFVNKIDYIFIDGSHSYEYVMNDTGKALQLLRGGRGIIVWHDYDGWEGVTRALNELYLRRAGFKRLKHIRGTSLVYLINDSKRRRK